MQTSEQNLERLLRAIISGIGRKTTAPEIKYLDEKSEFEVRVNPHDQGRFIGKKGVVIWGLQTIFWYAGLRQTNRTTGISLLEPDTNSSDRRAIPFRPDPKWDKETVLAMIQEIVLECFGPKAILDMDSSNGESAATVTVNTGSHDKDSFSEPDLAEAIRIVIRAAGMAHGANIETNFKWG